jgi:hypothetical protein
LNVSNLSKSPTTRLIRPHGIGVAASTDLQASQRIAQSALAVIDEISMLRAEELDVIYNSILEVGFTGAQLLLGNIAQLAPVMPNATLPQIYAHHISQAQCLVSYSPLC